MRKTYVMVSALYAIILGVLGGRTKQNNSLAQIPFLDRFQQHDYRLDFERVELVRFDKRYVKQGRVNTFKYNRTCTFINATFEFNIDIGIEQEIVAQVFKFASNEYRLFPIRFQVNFCQAFSKNIVGIVDFGKCGNFTGCHFLKGKPYKTCNWAPNPEKFPPFIPNGQYMTELQGLYRSTELWMVRSQSTVSRPIPIPEK